MERERERESELNWKFREFFCLPILFWRFWKTKLGGKKNWRKRDRESELNQGNLENFFAFQFCFGKIFDESIRRFWKN